MTEMTLQQALDLAISHHTAGRLDTAMDLYSRILQVEPNHPETLRLLGVVYYSKGFPREAENLLRRSLALSPDNPVALHNLGTVLQMTGKIDEAIECLTRSIGLNPSIAENYNMLGCAYRQKDRTHEAIEAFKQAIRLRNEYPEAHNNLGSAYHKLWLLDPAIECYQRAIGFFPNLAAAHNNLGNAYKDQGRLKEAVEAFKKSIQCDPASPKAYSNLILAYQYDPDFDEQTIRHTLRQWSDNIASPLASLIRPHEIDAGANRPIRVGFVSPDLRIHPIGRLMVPLLTKINPSVCLPFCYYDLTVVDGVTEICRRYCPNWRFTQSMSDEELDAQIRRDRIDILVDLSSHTGHNRLTLFARKPAPVQVTWLAYCGTTGLQTMDYRLSDPQLDPPGSDMSGYVEKTEYLDCYWCYPAQGDSPDPGPPPVLKNGRLTFGNLNNPCKMSPGAARAWREILAQTPGSRLLLFAHEGSGRDFCRQAIAGDAVSPDRIEFVGHCGLSDYFRRYLDIDIVLDPFPYNGGITTCDALWMGAPVVSLIGNRAVGRAGFSMLSKIGLPELAADSVEKYIQIALELGRDIPRLSQIRQSLRSRMIRSPLMGAARFARNVENTLLKIWNNCRAWMDKKI